MKSDYSAKIIDFKNLEQFRLHDLRSSGKITVSVIDGERDYAEIFIEEKEYKKLKIKASEDSLDVSAGIMTVINSDVEIVVRACSLGLLSVAGDVTLECTKMSDDCRITCAGNVTADAALTGKYLKISSAGRCKLLLNGEFEKFSLTAAGSVDARLSGKTEKCLYECSGATRIEAENFSCNDCTVRSSGSSFYRVNAGKTLNVALSGGGSLEYDGDALLDSSISGGVTVRKIEKRRN